MLKSNFHNRHKIIKLNIILLLTYNKNLFYYQVMKWFTKIFIVLYIQKKSYFVVQRKLFKTQEINY